MVPAKDFPDPVRNAGCDLPAGAQTQRKRDEQSQILATRNSQWAQGLSTDFGWIRPDDQTQFRAWFKSGVFRVTVRTKSVP
jgi:hypothetical protein